MRTTVLLWRNGLGTRWLRSPRSVLSLVLVLFACYGLCDADEKSEKDNKAWTQSVVESWGGGKKDANQIWALNRHWIGMLEVVATTGSYKEGEHLAKDLKALPVRFNAIHGNDKWFR